MFILAKTRSKICTLLPSFSHLILKDMNTESTVNCAKYICSDTLAYFFNCFY